mgnify:CR=1 FL=1
MVFLSVVCVNNGLLYYFRGVRGKQNHGTRAQNGAVKESIAGVWFFLVVLS